MKLELGLGLALLWGSACSALSFTEQHVCTLIGCGDGVSISLRPTDGFWPDGDYTFALVVDGQTQSCIANVPKDLPQNGNIAEFACSPKDRSVYWTQDTSCQEQRDGNSVSQTCALIPNRFTANTNVSGTPAVFSVSLERDGVELIGQTVSPTYKESRPNGPECGPVCRQAKVELTF
jgi:hypothetical protein